LKAMLDNEVSFGLFHVDTKHEADQLKQELDQIFRVSQMAIICVDDININAEMKKLWSTALHKNAKKFEYPKLHATGYGVIFFNKEKNKNE